ncbi:heme transporter FLVCR1-like [Halichondria panicea]|uniref:heme transporter FLVCR1-like n=1 Tax=Halichondria panicea TaxID=6063 RepID=UPI00312BC638
MDGGSNSQDVVLSHEKAPLLSSTKVDTATDRSIQATQPSAEPVIRTYLWRWIVLIIYSVVSISVNLVWISSAPIADIMTCYYDVSVFWVNGLSEVYMLMYLIALFPIVWLLDKYGLRLTMILGAGFNAAGAALKVAGTGSNYFWITMFGQTLAGLSDVFIWTAGPLLSEVWFPSRERATATAIGTAISVQSGVLLGLGLTPFIVHSDLSLQFAVCGNTTIPPFANPGETKEWSDFIFSRLLYFNIGVAALSLLAFIFTLIAFHNAPPTPPSISRKLESEHKQSTGFQQFKEFLITTLGAFKNVHFVLYMIVASIILAMACTMESVINEIVHPFFPDYDEQIGYLGITAQATSIVAMFAAGIVLDWTKAFYAMNLFVCVLSVVCVVAWAVLILFQTNFYLLYIPAVLLGLSMASFLAVAYEYAIEMTYPLPEGTSAGLINAGSQLFSIVIITIMSYFNSVHMESVGLWFIVGITALGCLITIFVKPKLRRVNIEKKQ